jgi:hypothetical protein
MRIAQIRPLFRVLAVLAVVGLLAGLTVNATHESQRRTVLLPGGARFTVLGTAFGGQEFWVVKPWERLVSRVWHWLPRSLRGGLYDPFPAKGLGSATTMTVLFTVTDATGTNDMPLPDLAVPVAESKFEFPASKRFDNFGVHGRSGRVFPRAALSTMNREKAISYQSWARSSGRDTLGIPKPTRSHKRSGIDLRMANF